MELEDPCPVSPASLRSGCFSTFLDFYPFRHGIPGVFQSMMAHILHELPIHPGGMLLGVFLSSSYTLFCRLPCCHLVLLSTCSACTFSGTCDSFSPKPVWRSFSTSTNPAPICHYLSKSNLFPSTPTNSLIVSQHAELHRQLITEYDPVSLTPGSFGF